MSLIKLIYLTSDNTNRSSEVINLDNRIKDIFDEWEINVDSHVNLYETQLLIQSAMSCHLSERLKAYHDSHEVILSVGMTNDVSLPYEIKIDLIGENSFERLLRGKLGRID